MKGCDIEGLERLSCSSRQTQPETPTFVTAFRYSPNFPCAGEPKAKVVIAYILQALSYVTGNELRAK